MIRVYEIRTLTRFSLANDGIMYTLRRSRSSASQCPPSLVHKKLLVLGDTKSGKSSLLCRLRYNEYPGSSRMGYDDYELTMDSCKVRFMLVDANVYYDRLLPLFCVSTDVVLMCLPINSSTEAIDKLVEFWKPQVLDLYCNDVPVILVGTKADLREDKNERLISHEEACKLAEKIGAITYVECSAKLSFGVRELFDTAAGIVVARKTNTNKDAKADRRKSKCLLS